MLWGAWLVSVRDVVQKGAGFTITRIETRTGSAFSACPVPRGFWNKDKVKV